MNPLQLTDFTMTYDDGIVGEVSFIGTNTSRHHIELIESTAIFFSKDGIGFDEAHGNEKVDVQPNEEFTGSLRSYLFDRYLGVDLDEEITCIVRVVLYRREFFRLGEVNVPINDTKISKLMKKIDTQTLKPDIKIGVATFLRENEDDTTVQTRFALFNQSDSSLLVTGKVNLVDEDGTGYGVCENSVTIEPGRWGQTFLNAHGLNANIIPSAKARCSLALYYPVLSLDCDGRSGLG